MPPRHEGDFEREGEVVVLRNAILKAFSFFVFSGLALDSVATGEVSAEAAPPPTPMSLNRDRDAPSSAVPASSEIATPEAPAMILVEGEHCADVEQNCLKWLDPPPYNQLRCGEWSKPSKCKGGATHRKFYIDREEFSDTPSDMSSVPRVNTTWTEAKSLCEARGARLCKAEEWELACEGPEMIPYPYGWKRDASLCNFDRTDLGGANEKLTDHRAKLEEFPSCLSPFGVHDMAGNVDEWVEREGASAGHRGGLRGGWWLPGRNRCRAATNEHDEAYQGKQVGFRCCRDAD